VTASEKDFYLRSFRHRAILFHVGRDYEPAHIAEVIEELSANGTLVVISSRNWDARSQPILLNATRGKRWWRDLARISSTLVENGVARIARPTGAGRTQAIAGSCRLATALGIRKLVIVDPRGGLASPRGTRSFLNAPAAVRLLREQRSVAPWTKAEIRRFIDAVRGGVGSINLTTAEGLAQELFSYEGAGTLLTADDYCQIERLGADDFAEALVLLARGEREGFLRARTPEQRARILLGGHGAWFEGRRLAGIGALETEAYAKHSLGEVVGLYTITRFQGEGVGVNIVDRLVEVAGGQGLRALFACTSSPRAASFFERVGFAEVPASRAPRVKWKERRGPRPRVFWRDL
jgi:GNAT superfamily N-acetyltransferase